MSCDVDKAAEGCRISFNVGEVTEKFDNEQSS